MSSEETGIPREFVLKQIENEINAGFALVAAARQAYKQRQPVEAAGALAQATDAHEQILKEVSDSELGQLRALIRQVGELREAIDWLRETQFEPLNQK